MYVIIYELLFFNFQNSSNDDDLVCIEPKIECLDVSSSDEEERYYNPHLWETTYSDFSSDEERYYDSHLWEK